MAKCRSISSAFTVLWLALRGYRGSLFATLYRIFVKVEQRFFNIQMPFGVHTVSDREL
ncbi:MAG TPA: hypothetical protein H9880_05675 [Candidatus Anaerobutyricum avicola]|nr:hypothetical protein [Candidatus Anaerobutyricum avicola]